MRVLAISGSLRDDSNNTALLRALREEAPEGVDVDIWQGLKVIPPYDQDDDVVPGPEAVEAFRELVRESDAVFFATPEYNSSVPGALKNALDWASRPIATNAFRNKPVAVISSSAGAFGGVRDRANPVDVVGRGNDRDADLDHYAAASSVEAVSTSTPSDSRTSSRKASTGSGPGTRSSSWS